MKYVFTEMMQKVIGAVHNRLVEIKFVNNCFYSVRLTTPEDDFEGDPVDYYKPDEGFPVKLSQVCFMTLWPDDGSIIFHYLNGNTHKFLGSPKEQDKVTKLTDLFPFNTVSSIFLYTPTNKILVTENDKETHIVDLKDNLKYVDMVIKAITKDL